MNENEINLKAIPEDQNDQAMSIKNERIKNNFSPISKQRHINCTQSDYSNKIDYNEGEYYI